MFNRSIRLRNLEVFKLKAVVCLVNIFYYIAMIGWSKTNENLHDLTNHGVLLDNSVSQKQIQKKVKADIKF